MVSGALKRLKDNVERAARELATVRDHEQQLSAALLKGQEEVNRLRAELDDLRSERSSTRRKIDSMIKRFDKLGVDWGRAGQ